MELTLVVLVATELVQKRSEADRLEGRLHAAGDAAVLRAQAQRLQEQIDALKAQQNLLDEEMDKLGEKHIEATAGTEHPYVPKTKPSISVL